MKLCRPPEKAELPACGLECLSGTLFATIAGRVFSSAPAAKDHDASVMELEILAMCASERFNAEAGKATV